MRCCRLFLMVPLVLTILAGCLCGCNDEHDNYLEGSVADAYDTGFDTVRVRLYPGVELSIEYVSNNSAGEKIPVRVTLDVPPSGLEAGVTYDLAAAGTITRGVGYGTSPLPTMDSGELELTTYENTSGAEVSGTFHGVFTGTTGNRINLRGGFSDNLEVVAR